MTSEPYREQEFHEPCARCDALSVTTCPHCGVPLCREHAPRRRACCEPCEREYERLLQDAKWRGAKSSSGLAIYLAVVFGFFAAFGGLALLLLLPRAVFRAVVLYGSPVLVAATLWAVLPSRIDRRISRARWWLLERRLRRRFLSEGVTAALPAADGVEDDEA